MKIVVVSPYYSPEGGGLERYAHEMNARLVARGHEVVAIACTRGEAREEMLDGVKVRREKPWTFFSNTPIAPFIAQRIEEEALTADVILAHGPVPGPIESGAAAARRCDKPFVVVYHAGPTQGNGVLGRVASWSDRHTLERWALAHADRLVAVTDFVRDAALPGFQEKTDVIAPGVDAEFFAPAPKAPSGPPRVLFVGPMDKAYKWKGFHVLLEAFEKVARKDKEARLVAIGEGDALALYGQAAFSRGLGRRVEFPGRLASREALRSAYQQATILVLPSTTDAESFGMVLAEANACGLPVVASRVGGVPCFVRDGENGVLVEPSDPDALAKAILALLADAPRRAALGARGRDIVLASHGWDAASEALERSLATGIEAHRKRVIERATPEPEAAPA